jgi:hypothetical protein
MEFFSILQTGNETPDPGKIAGRLIGYRGCWKIRTGFGRRLIELGPLI